MTTLIYRGYCLQSQSGSEIWNVRIKKKILSGTLAAVKKSIDWWCDTSTIIDPAQLETSSSVEEPELVKQQENYKGHLIQSDTGEKNSWYCIFNGRLIKGSQNAIKTHIDKNTTNTTRK